MLDRSAEYSFHTPNNPPAGNLVAFARFFSGGGRAQIDNFRVTVIPEPSCIGLASIGLLAFLSRFRKTRLGIGKNI